MSNNQLKDLYHFSIFFNISIFILYMLISQDITSIHIYFNLGGGLKIDKEINFINLLIVIGLILVIVALLGAQVLGSGLSDESVKIFRRIVSYLILWITLSLFTLSFLEPLGIFANIFYWILTIIYVFGFIQDLGIGSET